MLNWGPVSTAPIFHPMRQGVALTETQAAVPHPPKSSPLNLEAVLATAYFGLTIYLLAAGLETVWAVVALVAGLLVALRWAVRNKYLRTPRSAPLLARLLDTLQGLPLYLLSLPMPLAASWFAGQRAIATTPTNYWVALGLWLGAITIFVALLLPWSGRLPRIDPNWWSSVPWLEVGAVTLLTLSAFGARLVDLADEPNPFSGDEANFAVQGLRVERGEATNMFSAGVPFAQPSMYFFVVALSFKAFGVGVLGDRLPSAIFGTLTVPLVYLLLRDLFDRRVALAGAVFMAVYHLGVHFARLGMNNISATFITVLALWLMARALRTERPLYFGLAGAAAGLTLYSYIGARLLPLVMVAWLAGVALRQPRLILRNAANLLVLAVGFAVVAGPQGLFYINEPDQFNAGLRASNIFASGWLDRETAIRGQGEAQILLDQIRQGFGVLVVYRETQPHYNAQQPLVDAFSRIPLLIGGLWALSRIWQPRNLMLMSLLVGTLVLGGAFAVPSPSAARYVTMIPAVAAFVALGVVKPADLAVRWWPRLKLVAPAVVAAVLALLAFVNIQFYFGHYLPRELYSGGNTDINEAAGRYIAGLGSTYVSYLLIDPFAVNEPDIAFFGRDATMVDVPPGFTSVPPPPVDKPNAAFLAAPHREEELRTIAGRCPGGTWRSFWDEHDQRFLFYSYETEDAASCVRALSGG